MAQELKMDDQMNERPRAEYDGNLKEVFVGAFLITLLALVLAEVAVYALYSVVGTSDMFWHLATTGVITVPITFPISFYVLLQKRRLEALSLELTHLASVDQMSGLLNRTVFLSQVKRMLRTPKAGPTAGSFLFIDADHFKNLNDNFGHATGDDAIRKIADIIQETAPIGSYSGRIGGEEFGVFIPLASRTIALSVAENIRRQVRKLVFDNGKCRHQLSVSIGCAIHKSGQSLSEFVQKADERMYLAKRSGRNCVAFEDLPVDTTPENSALATAS